MSQITILEEILAEFHRRIDDETGRVASGGATSYEDYQRRTASIKAFRQAIQIVYDIVQAKPREERT